MGAVTTGPASPLGGRVGLCFAAAMVIALAGCQTPAQDTAETTSPVAAATDGEAPEQVRTRFVGPSAFDSAGFESTSITEKVRFSPAEPTLDDDPEKLLGLDRSSLSTLLGRPKVVRRERPAEIWQYFGANCVFDVFLYEDGGAYRVVHSEARDAAAMRTEPRACLGQLLRSRPTEPVG